jgi:short-subunit dehydrogenase
LWAASGALRVLIRCAETTARIDSSEMPTHPVRLSARACETAGMSALRLTDAVCIVTGASSGIGAATARRLGEAGAIVVLAARRAERLERLAAELPRALAVPTDLTAPGHLERLVEATLAAYGRIDVLVNDAGQGLHVPLLELNPQDLRAVYELNVVAPLRAMQCVFPTMRTQGAGAIVNVSSATSLRVFPGLGGYSSTKAALNMLAQVARLEFAEAGVGVSLVYPSVTATEFHQRLRAGSFAGGAHHIPVDPPELAARAIVFAITSGEAHVLVGDPPRAITPGADDAWGALLARQAPRPGAGSGETVT